jgi:hypothetical protein
MLAIFVAGCTTVSTQTSVNSQAASLSAGSGAATGTVAATSRAPSPPQGELLPVEKWTATLVTARAVPALGDVNGISDAFTFEGRIYAHLTLTAQPGVHGGQPAMEVKWYSGDKLMAAQKAQLTVNKSPFYMVSSTSGTALGVGKARVEFVANGAVLGSRQFQVSEK